MTSTDPLHSESEDHPWKVQVPDHPARQDSPEFAAARRKMNELAGQAAGLIYGPAPYQDHHGGSLWLKDGQGWFMVRNLAGIEWSSQFCLDGEVRVLTRDLRWVPIKEVRAGQFLLGFDEDVPRGRWRRWRAAEVLAASVITRPCYDLTFDDGTKIRASAEHRWLVSHGSANRCLHSGASWVQTEKLSVPRGWTAREDDELRGACTVLRLVDVWDEDTTRGGGYLAAAFDADGWLSQPEDDGRGRGCGVPVRLGFAQRSHVILEEAERLLKERGFGYSLQCGSDNCNRLTLRTPEEIMRFLGSVRPQRLLADFQPAMLGPLQRIRAATLVNKKFAGEQPVVALATSTGTFVAEGLASHNCADPAKVDLLRQNAKRLYDLLAPEVKQELDPDGLLETPIQDAAGVARWTDSIFNAAVPLHPGFHTGVLPADGTQNASAAADPEPGGVHHYPTPIADVQLFKYDDFELWVTDEEGHPAAVAPIAHRGSGNASVHVLYATPGSRLARQKEAAERTNSPLILGPEHPLAKQAYKNQ